MKKIPHQERTLILIKPDALQRALVGEIIGRFERKGLQLIGMKMVRIDDALAAVHYNHLTDKPFYESLRQFITQAPVVALALAGPNAVSAVRLIVGPTKGYEADAGSIRGDLSMSGQSNVVHASDSVENGEQEIGRFFSEAEIFEYTRPDMHLLYSEFLEKDTE
jgi:nucleoside-diphosphate kinase